MTTKSAPLRPAETQKFAAALGAGLLLLHLLFFPQRPILIWASLAVLLTGLIAPSLIRPLERVLAWVGDRIGAAATAGLLTLLFYLVLTPTARVRRWMGREGLPLRFRDDRVATYFRDRPKPEVGPDDLASPY